MDRSYLSDLKVVEASRKFVCIRPISYEDEAENKFLKSFGAGRSGDVENTVFCILSPDGSQRLIRPSRSAKQIFADANAMADAMNRFAEKYPAKAGGTPPLPFMQDLRLAVNVAACDHLPLVVVQNVGVEIENALAKLAWSEPFMGKCLFVRSDSKQAAILAEGVEPSSKVMVLQPDQFGLKARVLFQTGDVSNVSVLSELQKGIESGVWPEIDFWNHVRKGHQQGVFWNTKLPVTDKEELSARERAKKNFSPKSN
jgi:hypothetical protein